MILTMHQRTNRPTNIASEHQRLAATDNSYVSMETLGFVPYRAFLSSYSSHLYITSASINPRDG